MWYNTEKKIPAGVREYSTGESGKGAFMRRSTAFLVSVIALLAGVIAGLLLAPARNGFGNFWGPGAHYNFEGVTLEKAGKRHGRPQE